MLKIITSGEYSDYEIDGLFDLPESFDVKAEFAAFLALHGITPEMSEDERSPARKALYEKLFGPKDYVFYDSELVVPWLRSLGYEEVDFEESNPTLRTA